MYFGGASNVENTGKRSKGSIKKRRGGSRKTSKKRNSMTSTNLMQTPMDQKEAANRDSLATTRMMNMNASNEEKDNRSVNGRTMSFSEIQIEDQPDTS